MPIIDARKHTAPHNDDTPRRQAINDLSLTVNDIVPVANTTERAQLVADLAAAGFPTGSGRPLYVHRMDAPAGSRLEVNDGGSPFRRVVPLIQHGVRQMPANTLAAGAGTSTGGTVTLAEPMPGANYDVQVTLRSAQSGTGTLVPRVLSVTTTGFVIWVYNTGGSPVSWSGELSVGWKATLV